MKYKWFNLKASLYKQSIYSPDEKLCTFTDRKNKGPSKKMSFIYAILHGMASPTAQLLCQVTGRGRLHEKSALSHQKNLLNLPQHISTCLCCKGVS